MVPEKMVLKPKMACRMVDLPAPFGSDQAERLAAADQQVDTMQDLHLAIAGMEIVERQIGITIDKGGEIVPCHRAGDLCHLLGHVVDGDQCRDVTGVITPAAFSRAVVVGHQWAPR